MYSLVDVVDTKMWSDEILSVCPVSEGVTTFYPVTCHYRIRIFPHRSVGVIESPPDSMVCRIKLFSIVLSLGIAFPLIGLIKGFFHEI